MSGHLTGDARKRAVDLRTTTEAEADKNAADARAVLDAEHSAEKDAGLTEAERKALAHAIEDDLHRLSALNETGAPSAHWFGWFLMNKGNQHLVPEIERIVAARTRVTSPAGGREQAARDA